MAEAARPPGPAAGPQAPHAAFFGPVARGNPVVDSFETELRRVLSSLRRLRGAGEAEPPQHDLHRHGANTLFNIWIKYKPRLPEWYYNERLVKVGDTLAQIKEYKLALLQCYERYLQQFGSVNLDGVMDDVHRFKSTFFPSGVRDKKAALTFHALQGRNVCIYQVVCSRDRNLQYRESLQTCLNVLTSLRLTMQVALPQENLCWLIYNGTIHIYTICRHLMVMGQSAKIFARRGLIKIDEVKQLEDISSLGRTETKKIFREATLKMSVMIFKRAVYVSRKSSTRHEPKVNPRKAVNLSLPRTITERLLVEMFNGAAAQFLAILEALSDNSRNLFPPHPPDETEIRVVTTELFSAGLEILSGGETNVTSQFGIINPSSTLLQLMLTGEKGISGDAAVKFVKLAFSYEEWDVFYSAFEFVDNFLQAQDDPTWKKAEIELKLLTLMQPVIFPGKFERSFSISDRNSRKASTLQGSEKTETIRRKSLKPKDPFHDLTILATTVLSCVSTSDQNVHPDKEILVNVVMCLWQKCKTELQQIQMSGSDCLEYIHKHQAYQWVHILWIMNEIIGKSSIADTNVMFAEITLCLASILENIAESTGESKEKGGGGASLSQDETCDMPEILMKTPAEQLQIAYEILEKAINGMNTSRLMTLLPDGKSIFDNCCTMVYSNKQSLNSLLGCGDGKRGADNGFVTDLHLELIQAQHRVAVKLLKITQGARVVDRSLKSSKSHEKNIDDFQYLSEELIMKKIKRNKLSRAIFLMQKAAQKFPEDLTTTSQRQLLEEALTLIEQVEAEQSALYRSLKEAMSSKKKSRTPPPPLLLSRSHCSMTFKPAPFHSDIQVSWYCILGSVAGGSNTKVRLNSNKLQNSGEQIPADGKTLLEVQGLDANEKYIFAVAAYSSDGKLIGDAVGQMTKPILAYPPLSAITVRAYLTQVAYQTGNFRLARAAFSSMWDYFVSDSSPLPPNAAVISASSNLTISEKRLHFKAVSQTSPITLHLFLRDIFAVSDINVMEGALYSDSICSNEIFYKNQVARLAECERMIVAIELSNWLNDASYALQSVVQCYGLLAPLIYHKIFSVPVVQILIKCLAVLQEIPSATLQRRQEGCYESIQHMIACTSYHTAKVLHSWEEYELAVIIINYGKKLLISPAVSPSLSGNVKTEEKHTGRGKYSSRTSHLAAMAKAAENLSTLESSLLKLTEPGSGTQVAVKEGPLFLYPVISCWPSERAYREVLKFRGETRFLEFFVQLMHKVLNEEKFQCVLEWADGVEDYIKRRNEDFLGTDGISTQARSLTLAESTQAADVQKGKDTLLSTKSKASASKKPTKKAVPKKGPLREYLMKNPDAMNSPETEKKGKDKLKKLALQTLVMLLSKYITRSRFCQMCLEEMPWKSQMNIYLAVAHYHLFKKNLEEQYNIGISGTQHLDSYNILDPEIFSLNNSGTVLVREVVKDNIEKPTAPLPEKSETQTFKSPKNRSKQSRATRSRSGKTAEEQDQFPSNTLLLKHFTSIFLHLKRAVVLAHRGGHWTLLQNACRELWNYTQEFQLVANQSPFRMDAFPITWDLLWNTIWLPFYFASDMIIDMIIDLQASSSLKIVDPEGDFCIPSCLGGIMHENGGSNLHPQPPLDDVNVVDLRWICNLILKTIELLYHMKKWKALVHIAVQFNIFTHERFTEQVSPLLVYAQRQLLERIQQFSGPDSHEPHFTKYLSDGAQKMTCRNYIGYKLELPVARSASEGVFPGHSFNAEMNNDPTDNNQRKALVCVPLDVNDTLKCFRETLEKSKYQSRALRHSRKLLSLFLAHTQGNAGRAISNHNSSSRTLKFNVGDEVIFPPTPCDLSNEKYIFSSMVESRQIPKSQIPVIISSYEQTIGILEMNNQRDLKVQALHELGNLQLYSGNKRAALKCWCQALDETLNIADALNIWEDLSFPKDATDCFAVRRSVDMSETFLSQAGAWGCLHAAVLVAKIAQYITTSQMRLRRKYCYFSAILFKEKWRSETLFRASLPHPTSDYDFVQYETNILIPGIDLFSDRYRADTSTVVASLNFIMFELHYAKQNLIILPLFTLYQYIVSEICKDPVKCIEGRILKINVLADLGFFTEAFHELSLLILGEKIPWKIPAGYRHTEQIQALQKFDSSQSLMTATNLQVLEDTFNWSLSLTMLPLCNQQIMNKLTLAKMHLIICLSATINNIPEKVERNVYSFDINNLPEPNKTTASTVKVDADYNSRQQEQRDRMVHLVHCKEELNIAMLKGILLTEAEESLSYLVQDIQDKYDGAISQYSVEDLEAITEAKLELASISQQRYHAALSVAWAFSAIRFLQDARGFSMDMAHFQEEKDERECLESTTEDVQLPPHVTAQEHVNVHLWLRCRAMLVTALVTQIHGVGSMKGKAVAERRSAVEEVILEAEAFGDIETQTEVMVQAAILDLRERRPVADIKHLLQKIISLLQEDAFISLPASLTLVKSVLLLTDILPLQIVEDLEHCSSPVEPLNLLVLSHELTIKAIFDCGEPIEQQMEDSTLSCVVLPLKNIYLSHINLLAQVKMKIGYILAEKLASTASRDHLKWLGALRHLESALNLCRASATKKLDMEAEILFQIGKTERQRTEAGHNKSSQAVETLLEAIKITQQYDQKYDLIKQSYLEIALSYLYFARNEDLSETDESMPSTLSSSSGDRSSDEAIKSEVYQVQAWVAIRAAAQVSEAMVASQLLIGMKGVKEWNMKDEVQEKVPEFASMDLFSSYTDFISVADGYNSVPETLKVFSTEKKQITEDHQSLSEGIESHVTKVSLKKDAITWVDMVRYHNHLKRIYNTHLSAPGSLFARHGHVGLISDTGVVLRIAAMHSFLEKNLFEYSVCIFDNFPIELHDAEEPVSSHTDSSEMSFELSEITSVVSQVRTASPVSVIVEEYERTESKAARAQEKEISIQWYIPSVAKPSKDTETKVLLLYAYNINPVKVGDIAIFSTSVFSGHLWIPLARIISVREKLSHLKEQVEILIQGSKNFATSVPTSFLEQSETWKISFTNKPKMGLWRLDEKTEEIAKRCLSEVKALLSVGRALSSPLTEIPFDVTLQTIKNLEDMFNLASGCIITEENLLDWIISLLH